jgi:hypothetical protein
MLACDVCRSVDAVQSCCIGLFHLKGGEVGDRIGPPFSVDLCADHRDMLHRDLASLILARTRKNAANAKLVSALEAMDPFSNG